MPTAIISHCILTVPLGLTIEKKIQTTCICYQMCIWADGLIRFEGLWSLAVWTLVQKYFILLNEVNLTE